MTACDLLNTNSPYQLPCSISHNDLDGYGSQGIVIQIIRKLFKYSGKIKTYNVSYKNIIPVTNPEEYHLYFFTDLSISNASDAEKMLQLVANKSNIVIWIDHHQSSIDFYNTYPELKDIYGIRDVRGSATLLTWVFYQYLYTAIKQDKDADIVEVIKNFSYLNLDEILDPENESFGVLPEYSKYSHKHYLPYGVELVDDYDRFALRHKKSKWLNGAFGLHPQILKSVHNQFFLKILTSYTEESIYTIDNICSFGYQVMTWSRLFDLKNLKYNGFVAKFKHEKLKDINLLCVNTTSYGSDSFGSLFNGNAELKYDYVCRFSKKLDYYTYSIYYNGPKDQLNAKDICELYNGGGHPGAAGFISKDLIDMEVTPLDYEAIKIIDADISATIKEMTQN